MKIEPKGKTLAELDVKPGDVVTLAGKSQSHHTLHHMTGDGRWCTGEAEYSHLVRDPVWRIVSRANEPTEDKPKTWGPWIGRTVGQNMDHLGLVIVDWMDARGMTCCAVDDDNDGTEANTLNWDRCGNPVVAYRIRKEPVRGTVSDSVKIEAGRIYNSLTPTHRITFDTIDGKPDCSSIVMEAIGPE